MAVSKKAASSKAAPKADSNDCAKCDAKIEALEKKVAELESQLGGLGDALEGLTNSYKLGKDKLVSEVQELKEKAKSWKEKADTNKDGKVDFEEIYLYVKRRLSSRSR